MSGSPVQSPSAATAISRRYVRAGAAAGLGLLLGLLLVAGFAPPASAHDRLVESDPASGAVLTSVPDDIVLTFNVDVQSLGTELALTDSRGEQASSSQTAVSGREVSLPVSADLPDGSYTVLYRVTSSDGHPISGELPFTLEDTAADPATDPATGSATTSAPTSTPASPGSAPPSSAPSGATSGPDRSTPAGQSGPSEGVAAPAASTGFPWAAVLGGLAIVVVVGVGVAARRRGTAQGR